MNLSSTSIERPVLSTVMSLVIIIFGVIGFDSLGVREFPSVDPPIITVTTNYIGANADIIESQITERLEEAISEIQGIKTLSSISSDGRSTITVEFDLGMDLDNAANDIRDKVSGAVRNIPQDADPPIVAKSDADAETIFSLTVQSSTKSLLELTELGNNVFKERLQTIPGISKIYIWGEKRFSMKLMLDPLKMAGFGVTVRDIRDALNRENVELPSGRIEGNQVELTIRTFGRLTDEEDFNNLIIREDNNGVLRFKDVGSAELRPQNERTLLRGNGGEPMIGIAVQPQPGANYIDIVDEIYNRVSLIQRELPDDVRLGVALDNTVNIRKSIKEVQGTVLIAFLLVVLVIFLFLRDWRTTLIPIIAIPISLIGTFFVMYIMDFSINILTLLGIVLATGLVVDDAIVVMENIYTKVEKGKKARQAAHEGAKEIIFAVIATTVTLVAVFLPIIFLEGLTGRLFREFGIVVAGAVIISSFVSLTLTPMMSARILKKKKKKNLFYRKTESFFNWLTNAYENTLRKSINWRSMSPLFIVLTAVIIVVIWRELPSELAPLEDKGRFQIISSAPEGTSFEAMDKNQLDIIALVDTLQEKRDVLSVTSPGFGSSISTNRGFVRLSLVSRSERKRTQMEIVASLNPLMRNYPFARTFIVQEQTIGGGRNSGLPVQFVLQASTLSQLEEILPKFLEQARSNPIFQIVDIDLKFNKPEIQVTINREKARLQGVAVSDIAETLQLYFSGQRYGYFIMKGKQYEVIGQAKKEFRDEPNDLNLVYVRNRDNNLVPIQNFIQVEDASSPPQLFRYNRYISATISASTVDGKTIGDGIQEMRKIASEVLDDNFSTALAGTSKEYEESASSLLFAFILALLLVYLVLAAQFESFRDPLIIMFTVPLALAGALLSLWLFDQTINIFSEIGIIVLIGIVTKNGILIVEFANQKRKEGIDKWNAIVSASAQRFRPILMTSMATILGAIPIALALGDAATSRIPMGISVIGGLLFSLGLTLYIIPALYLLLSGKKRTINNEEL